jgi:hypothetical protein
MLPRHINSQFCVTLIQSPHSLIRATQLAAHTTESSTGSSQWAGSGCGCQNCRKLEHTAWIVVRTVSSLGSDLSAAASFLHSFKAVSITYCTDSVPPDNSLEIHSLRTSLRCLRIALQPSL